MWTRQKKKDLEDESTEDLNPLSQGKQLPRTPPKISQQTQGAIPKKSLKMEEDPKIISLSADLKNLDISSNEVCSNKANMEVKIDISKNRLLLLLKNKLDKVNQPSVNIFSIEEGLSKYHSSL